jgi:DNA-binding MarR family transcriptional regulator
MPPVNRHVSLLFHMGERFINRELAGTGMTSATAPLLLELRDGGARNPTALAAAVGLDKGHVTRLLKSLKRDGYVAIVPDSRDGRMLTVSLTRKGRTAAARAEDAFETWLTIVTSGVALGDLKVVDAVLDAFYANAVRHVTQPASAAKMSAGRPRA